MVSVLDSWCRSARFYLVPHLLAASPTLLHRMRIVTWSTTREECRIFHELFQEKGSGMFLERVSCTTCWLYDHCQHTAGAGVLCIQRWVPPRASAKAQTQSYSEDAFFLLCTAINPAILGKMYQSSKPFRIDMKMFHNKTNAAFYEQQNMGNTQLNLNPSEISLIFSHSNVGGQISVSHVWGRPAQPIHGSQRGCPDLYPCLGRMGVEKSQHES